MTRSAQRPTRSLGRRTDHGGTPFPNEPRASTLGEGWLVVWFDGSLAGGIRGNGGEGGCLPNRRRRSGLRRWRRPTHFARRFCRRRERVATHGRRGWLMRRALVAADAIGITLAFAMSSLAFPTRRRSDRIQPSGEVLLFVLTLPMWLAAREAPGTLRAGRGAHRPFDDRRDRRRRSSSSRSEPGSSRRCPG